MGRFAVKLSFIRKTLLLNGLLIYAFSLPLTAQESETSGNKVKRNETSQVSAGEHQKNLFRAVMVKQGNAAYHYAREMAGGKNISRAIEVYREYLILYPRHQSRFDAMVELAGLLASENKKRDAAELYEEAYREDFRSLRGAEAYLKAGKIYLQLGEIERGKSILLDLSKIFPYSKISRQATLELKSYFPEESILNESESGVIESRYSKKESSENDLNFPKTDIIEKR